MTGGLMLVGLLLAGQAAAPAAEDLQTEVSRLVRQLDAPQLAQREAAEAELLKRGPAVLSLLPPDSDLASAEVQQRLGRIRQRLQQAAAEAVAKASLVTLHADAMPLLKVLGALQEQSGNPIVDYRRQFSQPVTDPKLTVNFDKTPFWPALDRVLDQAGLTVYPYAGQRVIDVVAVSSDFHRAKRAGQASYSGPFRFEADSVVAQHYPLNADGDSLAVWFEAAWEPRLRIVSLVHRMADVAAVDQRGNPLPVANREAQYESAIGNETLATRLDVRLRLPPRDVQRIASLKGKLVATIAGKIETFRFRNLADAKNAQQRIAGVTVTLEQLRQSSKVPHSRSARDKAWEVCIRVRFDDAGDALASHRQWVFSNPAYLEGPDGKPIAYDTLETTAQEKNEVGLAYLFSTDRPLVELTFVYKTPGAIVISNFDYELKDIKLP